MVNIIMCVKDRYTLTKQSIDTLRNHTDCKAYTLTIVDDGSSDFRVRRYLNDEVLVNSGNTTMLRVEYGTHHTSRLKNIGAWWAAEHFGRSNWIYFSDNDVYFLDEWLRKLIDLVARYPDFRVVGGQNHPYHHPIADAGINAKEYSALAGTSMLMSERTWSELGPFRRETAPGVCQGEDWLFGESIKADGGRIGVIYPHVVIHTGVTNSEGKPAIGSELFQRVSGVIYE